MNYYEILELDQRAHTEEIQEELHRLGRVWQKRMNAPDIRKRQEAELKLARIVEAKAIFKDEKGRTDYDQFLFSQIENEINLGDDHRTDNEELVALITKMNNASLQGNKAEALLIAKETIFKYPRSYVARLNASKFLYHMKRYEEALNYQRELETWELNDLEMLYLYKDILGIIFVEYQDIKQSGKYFDIALPLADVIHDDFLCSEAVLTWSVKYYVNIENYDAAIARFDQLTTRVKDVNITVYFWILEAIKLKCESLYDKNQNGEFVVTNLEQISAIESLLLKANGLKGVNPDYDGRWIDARLNYLKLAVKEKNKSSQNMAYAALGGFGIMFLIRFLNGGLFTLFSGLLIVGMIYAFKYINTDNEPIYIKNRKYIK